MVHLFLFIMLSKIQISQLKIAADVNDLKNREERYAYYGILHQYQLYSREELRRLNYRKLNAYQHFLFKRVLHGLNVYTEEEVRKLHRAKKKRIRRVWSRAQEVINAWKQTICAKIMNDYLYHTFGKAAQRFLDVPCDEYLPEYNNTLTFKDLGLTYEDVILKFIAEGLLPKNFLSLDEKSIKENGKG